MRHALVHAVANLQRLDGFLQACGEIVEHAVLNKEAVGADAGLPGVAVFAGDRALHRLIEVGVVEHDERCVSAQLHAGFLDRRRALREELGAYLRAAGKGELAHHGIGGHLATDLRRRAGDHIADAGRQGRRAPPARRVRALRTVFVSRGVSRQRNRRPSLGRPFA